MAKEQSDCLILGVTQKGNKFRPSDWVDRIAALFASFTAERRLQYHAMIRPVIHQGLRGLFVAGSLAMADAVAYDFVMEFAGSNRLQIVQLGQHMTDPSSPTYELPNVA